MADADESSSSEEKEGFDDESALRKVLFDLSANKTDEGETSSPMKRRRSRHASLSGGEGTVCVPMIAGLTEQQVQGLREVFSLFDPEGSGRVRPEEIRSAATSSGLEKEFPEVWQFMTALDGHDSVDFQDFVALLTEPLGDHYSKAGTSRLMNLFGPDAVNADCVTLAHLRHLVDELGIQMDDEELRALLEKAGADADDRLSMDLFYNVMRHKDSD